MSINYQILQCNALKLAECYGRPITVNGDNTFATFCDYKEEKLNEWLTLTCWNKVCIPAKNLTSPIERGDLITDGGNTWYVMDPKPCMPGPLVIEYCAKVCENLFIHSITFQDRNIQGLQADAVDATENFIDESVALAKIDTVQGMEIFDGAGQLIGESTHRFTIPFQAGITSETWIFYDSRRFDIDRVQNLNEADQFLSILATEKGPASNSNNDT